MTCEEAIQYIHSNSWHKGKPGLERIRALLASIGDPQKSVRCIHVAGTNGKGSVCAMLDSILRTAGHRVGLFTSPYIRRFHERIQADGAQIGDKELAEITEYVRSYAETMDDAPNEFELITAIGFEFFRRRGVEYVVLEVGLGGRLDPTNVIEQPLLSIITDIDFDHTKQLGNTIQAIAAEKAGIIKEGCPVLYGGKDSSACRTVGAVASMRHAPFYTVDRSDYRVKEMTLDGTVFDFEEYSDLRLPLLGTYQPYNATTVLNAVRILESAGVRGLESAVPQGLAAVKWPARFELMRRDPTVICDGGHNPQGITAAVRSIERYFPEQKVNILTAMMMDKDFDQMIERMKPIAGQVYTVRPDNPRALSAQELAKFFEYHKISATPFESVADAVREAVEASRRDGVPLICLGSLYLYGHVADVLEQIDF